MKLIHAFLKLILTLWFRPRFTGLEKLDTRKPSLITPNHVSLLDAVLLSFYLPQDVTFVVNTEIAKRFSFFLRFCRFITVDPLNPYSVRQMLRVIRRGETLVIFPEGRITTTGGLMKMYSGVSYLALRTGVPVYPVMIQGAERSRFSYLRGKVRLRWFPRITFSIGDPYVIPHDPERSMREQKAQASDLVLRKMQNELFQSRMKQNVNLFDEILEASRLNGPGMEIARDLTTAVNYRTLLMASYLLAGKLRPMLLGKAAAGLLLPNSVGHLIALLSLFHIGKTPAILNFSLGTRSLLDCCETAGIDTILTSRVFVEKGKLEYLIEALSAKARIVYLEDLKASATAFDKGKALFRYLCRQRAQAVTNELILFTSGSESSPKGVILTHTNLFANIQQVTSVIDITSRDKFFNALPMFHSFGLTAGTLLPVLKGVPVFLYPSPLHYKAISELVYDQNATILFGTSTFMAGYGRAAHPYNFHSLRYAFAGAEKLKEDVRQLWMEKFGVRILEGYGTTETAPILSLNTPLANKTGTVGRLLPGIEYRLEKVEGIEQGGELLVKGPNVMKGYLIHGKGFMPAGEWYRTGDLVEVDNDGFLTIQSRLRRFAKIGGEMISLNLIEELAMQCFGHSGFAAVAAGDSRKGERILLFTTDESVSLQQLRSYISQRRFSPLHVPASVKYTKTLPLLGSGKTDYVSLKQWAERGEEAS